MVDAGRDHVYSHSDNDTTTRGHNTDEREEEDELDAEEDGDIQLGLLSRKPRAGKERASDSSDVEGLTTKQLAMGILAETLPTLMGTVVGMVFTGELLERVATWRALHQLDELFILIPMLNNMKGNLEMNLSARLSTAANTGNLDDVLSRRIQLSGALSLIQVQALALSFLAAVASFALGKMLPSPTNDVVLPSGISRRGIQNRILLWSRASSTARGPTRPSKLPPTKAKSGFREFLAVVAVALSAASLSSITLGSFMCSIILLCRRFRLNPDNISPPLASCLGDLITLTLLSLLATLLTLPQLSAFRLPLIFTFLFAGILAWTTYTSLRNPISRPILKDGLGWVPLLCAMAISSGTGLVLDEFVTRWKDFGSLAVVIAGLPASLGAVFISRLSTELHAGAEDGGRSGDGSGKPMTIGVILFIVGLPVLLMYLVFVYSAGWVDLPLLFLVMFVLAFALSSVASLWLANWLTRQLWARGYDPDTYCLPVHSSIMELTGQCLLVVAYAAASSLGVDVRIAELVQ